MDFSLTPDIRFRKYFVLFRPTRWPQWWSVFTVPSIGHCSVIETVMYPEAGLSAIEYCVHTEMCFGIISQEIHWKSAVEMISEELVTGRITVVAAIDVEKKYRYGYIPLGLFNCVTLVKSLLGVHDWRIQTPQSLLRCLESRGAVIVRGFRNEWNY